MSDAVAGAEFVNPRAKYRFDKLFKRLRRKVGSAIADYSMIEEGDRILVAVSGGKDSYALLDLLLSLRRSAPVSFDLIPAHIAAGFEGVDEGPLREYLEALGLPYIWREVPIARICAEQLPPGKPYCPLCSRLRRGYLYRCARESGAGKVALGHHKDDALATFFLNLFYQGMLKSMPPAVRDDAGDLSVIRPLCYCRERDLTTLAALRGYPLLPKGGCGFGEQEERAAMRRMIRSWDRDFPKRADIAFRALKTVVPSHLYDRGLHDFAAAARGRK
ncbi:MAG: tRNA 2-thiocytidine(32) synthetase TtcA [Succinivibrionaceae bacterium]|nr:tRNA 2-thiocytidine(32) synthetase TtcA [Succinivibrionaceae bacterium]